MFWYRLAVDYWKCCWRGWVRFARSLPEQRRTRKVGKALHLARFHAAQPDIMEAWFLRIPRGGMSRVRLLFYRLLGMKQGRRNRMEGGGRCRRLLKSRSEIIMLLLKAAGFGHWMRTSMEFESKIGSGKLF